MAGELIEFKGKNRVLLRLENIGLSFLFEAPKDKLLDEMLSLHGVFCGLRYTYGIYMVHDVLGGGLDKMRGCEIW